MNISTTIWTAIIDHGDGSHGVRHFPSEEALRSCLELDEYDCSPKYEIPVEVQSRIIDLSDFTLNIKA